MTRIPVVVYAVKSSPDPRDSTGSQIAHVVRAVEAGNGEGDRYFYAPPASFREERQSGFTKDRGRALEAAVETAVRAAREHGYAELWVAITSRLGRGSGLLGEARAYGKLWYDLRAAGVQLRSVDDDEFATNEAMVGIASMQHHKYSADLSANVLRGKTRQFIDGQWMGGTVPSGFLAHSERQGRAMFHTLVRDPDREQVTERLFALALDGTSMTPSRIARQLNSEGLRTVNGRPWTYRTVHNILTNPIYAGAVVRHRGRPDEAINWNGNHRAAAYISREQHESIRADIRRRDRAVGRRPHKLTGRPTTHFALWKLATCGRCGEPMRCDSGKLRRDGTRRRSYGCANVLGATGLCDAPMIDALAVDASLVGKLDTLMFDFDGWFSTVTRTQRDERAAAEAELAVVRDDLAANERRQRLVRRDYLRQLEAGKEAAADVAAAALEDLTQEQQRLERAAGNLQAKMDTEPDTTHVDAALDWWNDVRRQLRTGADGRSMGDVNAVLRDLFTTFHLSTSARGVVVEPVFTPPADLRREPWDENDDTTLVSETYYMPVGAAAPFAVAGNALDAWAA